MPFLLQGKSVNGLLTSRKNKMFGKNLILELWSKNLKANQNVEFFEQENLTNKLKYEVKNLDVTRDPQKQQILVGYFKWVWSRISGHAQSDEK